MRKHLMGMIAVILAIGFSAFTNEKNSTKKPFSGEQWFVFNGTDPTDLNDATMYSLDGTGATSSCPTASAAYRCGVKAVPQSGSNPLVPDLATIIAERKKTTTP